MKTRQIISVILAITVILSIISIVPFSVGAAEVGSSSNTENETQPETSVTNEMIFEPDVETSVTTDDTENEDKNDVQIGADSDENSEELADPAENTIIPAAPTIIVSNVIDGIKVSWNSVNNASSYTVFYKSISESDWTSFDTTDTSYVIDDVVPGKLYDVKVQSIGNNGVKGNTSSAVRIRFIDRVQITGISFNGSSNVLTYNEVGGANKFQIAKKKSGDKSYTYYTTTENTFTDNNVVKATVYNYQVRAMFVSRNNETTYGAWSSTYSVVTLAQTNVSLANKSNGIRAQWNAVSGAERYAVYFKSADDANWSSASTTNTYYPILNVKSGKLYYVQVRPVKGKMSGAYSKVKSMTFIGRTTVTTSNAAGGINASWKSVDGANRYQIAKKKKGASSYSYYFSDVTSYLDSDVSGNTVYLYQVRAMYQTVNSGIAYGAWSPTSSILKLAQPTVSLSNKSNGLRVDWSKVPGAKKYVVYIKAASATKWQSATTTNTYYPMLTVKSGTLYYVQVRPIADGVNGPYSKPKSMTYIGPTTLKLSMSGSDLMLGWNNVTGANKFQIAKIKKGSSAYDYILTTGKSYIDKSVAGTKDFYSYQVRAMYTTPDKGTAYGAWSAAWHFNNGKIVYNGFQIINGYRYYYRNGVILKNQIVGSKSEGYYYADSYGACCVSEEMRLAAQFVMTYGSGKTGAERMKTSFRALAKYFPYKRTYDHPKSKSALAPLAIDMFKNKKGNCFRYAACFTCIAKVCGYRARMAVGNTSNGSPHGWTEVYVNGKWYYCDPDMQLPGYGFPDYYAYMRSSHPWGVKAKFRSEVTISKGKATWN